MPTITIKNIPDELKRAAQANRRSINSEVIVCIERSLRPQRLDVEAVLARAAQIREPSAAHEIGDEEFTAKSAGRP